MYSRRQATSKQIRRARPCFSYSTDLPQYSQTIVISTPKCSALESPPCPFLPSYELIIGSGFVSLISRRLPMQSCANSSAWHSMAE